MTTATAVHISFKERIVGKVLAEIRLTNARDVILEEENLLPLAAVRTMTLSEVLVDTGATTLCLPEDMVAQLGFRLLDEVLVETSSGVLVSRRFENVRLEVLGRRATIECIELPAGRPPLLGVIPLEILGLQPDIRRHVLTLLPLGPDRSYLTI